MINQTAVIMGAFRYEFMMQIRRRSLWITFLLMICLLILFATRIPSLPQYVGDALVHNSLTYNVAYWTFTVNRLLPLGVGCLLADRLVRDYRTKLDELFVTTPGMLGSRLLGKYTGTLLATLIPFFLGDLLGVGYIIARTGNLLALPIALETFAVLTLPGMLFVAAFALACPLLMWVPLFQFCFIGYWFWGNELGTRNGIPTLSGTILTPIGSYMAQGFYGIEDGMSFSATSLQAVESILLLIGIAALVMMTLWWFLKYRQARQ
jgi:ABC-2 type transport system permease protein